jgi:hypothetical protein
MKISTRADLKQHALGFQLARVAISNSTRADLKQHTLGF